MKDPISETEGTDARLAFPSPTNPSRILAYVCDYSLKDAKKHQSYWPS